MAAKKGSAKAKSETAKRKAREKARAYRERMRAKGLRPVQFWLPDTRSPEFAKRAHQASLAVANSPHATEDQDFVDALSEDLFE
jgi:hypothetical protein